MCRLPCAQWRLATVTPGPKQTLDASSDSILCKTWSCWKCDKVKKCAPYIAWGEIYLHNQVTLLNGRAHGFSRQSYWSRLPYAPPRIFPTQGSNFSLLNFLHRFTAEPLRKPYIHGAQYADSQPACWIEGIFFFFNKGEAKHKMNNPGRGNASYPLISTWLSTSLSPSAFEVHTVIEWCTLF